VFNFLIPPPERVSVEKPKIERLIALVDALHCETIRCKNASEFGRVICLRCEALNAAKDLAETSDVILIGSGLG
jgi:hypothetical protein